MINKLELKDKNMKMKLSLLVMVGLVIAGCEQKEETSGSQPSPANPAVAAVAAARTGVIEEVLQATEYTYLKVKEGELTVWMAVTKQEIKEGTTIGYTPTLEMKDFESKDLKRTFDSLYLMDSISIAGQGSTATPAAANPHQAMSGMTTKTPTSTGKLEEVIEPVAGGISIAQLYGDTAAYGGQSVQIRGKVTKINTGIMGKNWIHIQDGTEADGQFDLTVTTQDTAKVGDVLVVHGKITLDKDFGSGYRYDVIMEDGHCHPE